MLNVSVAITLFMCYATDRSRLVLPADGRCWQHKTLASTGQEIIFFRCGNLSNLHHEFLCYDNVVTIVQMLSLFKLADSLTDVCVFVSIAVCLRYICCTELIFISRLTAMTYQL